MLNLVANGPLGYTISNSLRFRSSASAYLSRTAGTPTNNKIWTWSGWVKRGQLGTTVAGTMMAAGSVGVPYTEILFNGDVLSLVEYNGSSVLQANYATTQVFRDPSAWYHIVVAVDTTQATSTNRIKMYVNGTQITSFSTSNAYSQNYNTQINGPSIVQNIGRYTGAGDYFDGYLTEVNFVDGQQLTPSSFGSTNASTNVWQPAKYTNTYGTNGFYLNFSSIALTSGSNTGLGKDNSGNGNYWNTNNISVTAGSTYDAMTDVPTLTSATVANYAVLNPVYKSASQPTISNGNLTVAGNTINYQNAFSSIGVTSGKWYCEVLVTGTPNSANMIGVSNATQLNYLTGTADTVGAATGVGYGYYIFNGQKTTNNTSTAYGNSIASGDIVGIALDLDNGKIWFSKNGTWQASGDPVAGTNAAFTGIASDTWSIGSTSYSTGATSFNHNFGQRPFSYSAPTGFKAINTYNLPDSTIKKGNTVMDATLYTGNLTGQSITNAAAFKPDLVWIKSRSAATDHKLTDFVRGATKALISDTTGAETTDTTGLTAFNTNGFTVGASTVYNNTAATYVAWQWAGTGSSASNTSGTITSTVDANTSAGFSVVTYTGTGANATVGHGLGVAPKMVIVKKRSATGNWIVWQTSLGGTQYLLLNLTNAVAAAATVWNSTTPTSTVFSVGTDTDVNANTSTYVAYCWAEIAGYSKAFSYTGNGSTDGSFVYTGFLPRFVLIKRTDTTGDWYMWDTARNTYDVITNTLLANSSAAETSATSIDALSNGFKLRNTTAGFNASGGTYIGMAWATNPFKNSNAF